VSSRLAVDQWGRKVAIITTRSLWLEPGEVFLVLDGHPFGLVPTRGRPAGARERMEAGKWFYDANSGKRARAEQPQVPDEELDEQAALAAAYAEQKREPADLVNLVAA
jgi:hypothetical protein